MARSFTHPSPKDFTIDAVLHAMADPVRRQILMKLMSCDSLSCTKSYDDISPSTLSFHMKVLRESGLIRSEKVGVSVMNTVRADEVNKRFPGLLDSILKNHKSTKS